MPSRSVQERQKTLADAGITGRQTDIRTADLKKGVWIVVVPDTDSPWVSHVWRKGREILGSREAADELCALLRDNGKKAIVVRIAPEADQKVAE